MLLHVGFNDDTENALLKKDARHADAYIDVGARVPAGSSTRNRNRVFLAVTFYFCPWTRKLRAGRVWR